MRTFLLPRSDYQIVHDWNVFGLQATGSHGIIVDKAFVPEHRTHKAVDGFLCKNPGQLQNTAPLYRLPWAQVFVRAVSSAAIGALQGALNAFIGIAAKRVSTNTGKSTKLDPFALNAAARTQSAILEMKTVLYKSFDDDDEAHQRRRGHPDPGPYPLPLRVLAGGAPLRGAVR